MFHRFPRCERTNYIDYMGYVSGWARGLIARDARIATFFCHQTAWTIVVEHGLSVKHCDFKRQVLEGTSTHSMGLT